MPPRSRRSTSLRPVRVSDAERERAVASLRRHYAAGRLQSSEFEDRVARAYSARWRADLAALVADLPSDRSARAMRGVYRWQWEALKYHAAAYVSVNGALVGIWAATGEGAFWPAWVLAPWMVMLGAHAAATRMLRRSLGLPPRRRR